MRDVISETDVFVKHDHAPPHLFRANATYFVTAKTLNGEPHMAAPHRRQQLLDALQFACRQRGWQRVAWVALSNHYHCILKAPEKGPAELAELLRSVHRFTSREWNREEGIQGRRVWYQYRDTCLSFVESFWPRVNYIHWNPVKHGLCSRPEEYPYSSYHAWQQLEGLDRDEVEYGHPWERLELE